MNVAYENANTFVDSLNRERFAIVPVVSAQLGRNTTLILEGQYRTNEQTEYFGLPAVGTVLRNPLGRVPKSRFLGDPNAERKFKEGFIGYRFEHKFSDSWSARNVFRASFLTADDKTLFATGLRPDNRTVTRSFNPLPLDSQSYRLQTDVLGTIITGVVKQDLLFGLELRRDSSDTQFLIGRNVPSIDLFNSVYNIPTLQFTPALDRYIQQNSIGAYAQNLISIGDKVKILLGGRFDFFEETVEQRLTDTEFYQQDTAFSPRVGIVYQPIKPVSLYASYSRSFVPSGADARNPDGTPFEPTTGEQFEAGVKTEFLNGRLSATLAAYQITKKNIVTSDPVRPNFSIQVGEQQSKGIELDVAGQILPGLNIIATYAYTDTEITKDNNGNQGNQPSNVPRRSASLWATYEIQRGGLKGLGFSAGFFFVGDREGDLANTFELPSYGRTDMAIFYRRNNWRVGLNIKNLFNVDYFENAQSRNVVYPGAPFTILGTISWQF